MNTHLFSQFEVLRARVESVIERPGTILVTSAKSGDGKSLVSYGLAERLAATGRRVALVSISGEGTNTVPRGLPTTRAFPILSLTGEDAPNALTPEQVKQLLANIRRRYEYVVVDGRPLLESRACIVAASAVDGLLIAVRHGRASNRDDAMLVDALESSEPRVIGVVSAVPSDIEAFARPAEVHPGDMPVTIFDLQNERSGLVNEPVALNLPKRVDSYA